MRKLYLSIVLLLLCISSNGQLTTAISPTGAGGFELGTDYASNGWTLVQATGINRWYLGNVAPPYAGSRCSFISNNGGVSYAFTNNNISGAHIYRDVVIPVGATSITLSFYYKVCGEGTGFDKLLVYTANTTHTPVANTPGTGSVVTMPGANPTTPVFTSVNGGTGATWTLGTVTLPNTWAGQTMRLIFTWKNDGSAGGQPPASLDNISLTYITPMPCSGTPTPGTVTGSPSTGCSPYSSSLSLSGGPVGVTGITYQWETSTNNTFWTPISSATNSTYTTPTISSTVYYRNVVGCSNVGGGSSPTPSQMFGISPCFNMPTTATPASATVCSGMFYDSGGPTGDYNCCSFTSQYTFYPSTPGKKVQLVFSFLTVETCCDYMRFFNGNSPSAPQIGANYTANPGTITSTAADGSLTVTFWSDVSVVAAGWAATIELVGTASNPITTQPAAVSSACQGGGIAPLAVAATGSTFTYQWYDNGTTNSNVGGTLISGATNSTYAPSTAAVGTKHYYAVVRDLCGVTTPSNVGQVVVSPPPPAITGLSAVCEGRTITLSNTITAGTWSSSSMPTATVVGAAGTATVTGVAAGIVNISYHTSAACFVTKTLTVNATPVPITTTTTFGVCEAGSINLTHPDGGTGTWVSAHPSNATVGLTSGIVNGISSGTALISYTNTNGCVRTRDITVNPLPVVNVTPSASVTICDGDATTLTANSPAPQMNLLSQDFNGTLGGWVVSNVGTPDPMAPWQLSMPPGLTGIAGDGSQYLQGYSQGAPLALNTTITSPSFSTMGGFGSVTLTFNQTLFSFAPPDVSATIEYSVNGGAWNPVMPNQAGTVINDGGTWSAANPQVTVDLPPAAISQPDVRLRWVYDAQSLYWVIDNISVKGTMPASTFSWSGAAGLSCTNCASPTITPAATGTNLYNVATTTSAGCVVNTPVTINVNALPNPIGGGVVVCEGVTSLLTSGPGSGTWQEGSGGSVVTIVSGTGAVTGVSAGMANVTFTATATGCSRTGVVNVLTAPAPNSMPTAAICIGSTISLTNATPSGAWSSSDAGIASVSSLGHVTGVSGGIANITYTVSSGCIALTTVTVNTPPAAITGASSVCVDAITAFSSTDPFGTWTSNNTGIASVNATTGEVMGVSAGNTVITYTLPTNCFSTKAIQAVAIPNASGPASVCQGQTTVFSGGSVGATWSSSAPAIATINSSGVVTTNNTFSGSLNILYTFGSTGCSKVMPFTVNARAPITGPAAVCEGSSVALSNVTPDGTWSSANDLIASVDMMTGVVTGVNAMNTIISYTSPAGCVSTRTIVVNPLPAVISGSATVCENGTTTVSNTTPMGLWSSSVPSVATINSFGEVTAMTTSGNTVISYTLITTGCRRTHDMAVMPLPDMISGTAAACANGGTTLLSSAPSGGAWSSSNSLVAAAGSATGIITGNVAGNVNITYMLPTGCFRSQSLVVNPLPNSITGTASVCEGLTTDLNNSTPGGTWTSLDGGLATVDAVTGLVLGMDDGVVGIAYTLGTGCGRTRMVTVNVVPDAFTGSLSACVGQQSNLFTTPAGGNWSVGSSSIATVNSSGVVTANTAGNTNISYTMPTGCRMVSQFTVNPLPTTILGVRSVCVGSTTTLSNGMTGGTWAIANPTLASIDMNTGVVNGLVDGITPVTYELPTGCKRIANVTVNPLPLPITGSSSVCQNATTPLTSATPGGTWTSANAVIATMGATSGIATGVAEGIVNISYTLPTGCRATRPIEVLPLPGDLTGPMAVCENAQITIASSTSGGTWSVDNSALAMIDASGNLMGMSAGNVVVKYTIPTGCFKTKTVVVNPIPAPIAGSNAICAGNTTVLTNITPNGTWSSSNPVVAPISASGGVFGNSNGFSIIHYTLPTGCSSNTTMVVNALPEPITGNAAVCAGGQTTLESASLGGSWTSSTGVAAINAAGVVTGVAAGTSMISYTNANGCRRTRMVTVNALPGLITGDAAICPGLTSALSNSATGGTWSTDNATMVNVHPLTGLATATGADGMANITYMLSTGCSRTKQINVHPAVDPITGAGAICKGNTAILVNTTTGGMWSSANTATATVDATGTVTGMGAGTVAIVYTMPTGCKATATMVINPVPGNITGAGAVCEGSSIAMSNILAGGAWSSSDDAIATISASGLVSGMGAGNVTVRYELPTGCFVTRNLVVNALPDTKNVTGGGSYCAGGTGVAIGVDETEAGTLYKLMLGTTTHVITTLGNGSGISYGNQLTAGTYMVTAVSPQGCMKDMNGDAVVVINPLITPSVSMASDLGATVCAGTAVTYTATGVDGGTTPSYVWSVNGTEVGTTNIYTFVPADGDDVSVKFISSEACPSPASVTSTMSMIVLPNLTPSVSIAVGPDDSVCQGSTAIFAAAPVNGGTTPAYVWLVNGSIVPGATNALYNYQPANNDIVLCRLNSSYACATANNVQSNSIKMHVDAVFTPIVEMTANPGVKVEQGTEVTFTATPLNAGDAPAFQWLINENAIAGATQPVFKTSDLENGDSVTCIVYGNAKCANLSINSIVMEVTQGSATSVTTNLMGNSEVRLIPNPNTGTFTVTGTLASKADENVALEVTDMLGQVIYRGTSVARNGIVNERIELGKTLANGMYMLSMGVGTERRAFHFVVKQ